MESGGAAATASAAGTKVFGGSRLKTLFGISKGGAHLNPLVIAHNKLNCMNYCCLNIEIPKIIVLLHRKGLAQPQHSQSRECFMLSASEATFTAKTLVF